MKARSCWAARTETRALSNKRIYSADAPPAFTRWRLAQLDEQSEAAPAPAPAPEAALLDYLAQQEEVAPAPSAPADPEPQAPDPAELEALRDEARAQGYAEGLESGRADAADDVAALGSLLEEVRRFWSNAQNELAPQVLELALDLARHLLRTELQQRPEAILPLVQEMVQALPQPGGHPRLHLHHLDAELVRAAMGDELDVSGWRIVTDTSLRRGDCVIETHHGELNGTLATRWQQLVTSLGVKRPLDDEPV